MGSKVEVIRQSSGTPNPGVIPTSQVIVLKEQDLDCDLATAIARIRSSDKTSHSRILVVAPDDGGDDEDTAVASEPSPPVAAPTTLGQVERRGQEAALEQIGRNLQPLGACLEHYLEEMRAAACELRDRLPDSVVADCEAPLRVLEQGIRWSESLTADLVDQVRDAQRGFHSVDTHALVQDMAGQVEALFPRLRISVGAPVDQPCPGRPADLAEAFFLGLVLVAQRIGGVGAIAVTFEKRPGSLMHHLSGNGEPTHPVSPDCVARFRKLVVDQHGGRIDRDELGHGGAGLCLHLPVC